MNKDYSVVGKSVPRKDARDKVTGSALFAADIDFEGQLYGAAVRCTLPSAHIRRIRTDKAMAMPGVACVLTAQDVPGDNRIGIIIKDEFVLCADKVRRVGDAVAIVAAETPWQAQAAAEAVEVEYEPIEPVLSIERALEPDAPCVHGDSNVLLRRHLERGDVDAAFEECHAVVENTYHTPMLTHMCIETEAGLARMEDGVMTVYCSTQNPHFCRSELARVLGLPMNGVRVCQTVTGGGFGGKLDISVQGHVALLAWHTGRPVKMVRTRRESTMVTSKRHPFIITAKTGATKDGRVLATDVRMLSDGGAYASYAPAVASRAIMHFMGPYQVPNVRGECVILYTNNPTAGAFRGFGMPQAAVCHEGQMNALARKLKIDPIELRLRNAHQVGSVTSTGQVLNDNVGFVETLLQARAKAREVMGEEVLA